MPITELTKQHFWSKVKNNNKKDCWEWTGCRLKSGYGRIGFGGRLYLAHRISYEISYGKIPNSIQVNHRCDNPSCVNPSHLYLGMQKDNVADMIRKGRKVNTPGEKNYFAKLTEIEVIGIRIMRQCGYKHKVIAGLYKTSEGHIEKICNRRVWKHI